MELKEGFRLDGVPHNRESLVRYCHDTLNRPGIPGWRKELCLFMHHWFDPAVPVIEQQTSGSTGKPRKHLFYREAMVRSAQNTLTQFNLQTGERVLLCLPIRYIAGKMMVVRAMVGGLDLVTVEPSGRPMTGWEGNVSFAAMVPIQVHESLHHGDDLSPVGILLIGGGEIHPTMRQHLAGMERPGIYESFAMTETCTHFALRRINGTDPDLLFLPMQGVSVSQDHRGCLVVNVDGVTGGPVTTNDLVEIEPHGKGFKWLGRVDHVINSGGIKIIPEILEQKIRAALGLDCLVLPEKDARLGNRLLLVIESEKSDPPVEQWLQSLREVLPTYEVPRRILTVPRIPRNPSFKPDRKETLRLVRIS
jgi:O-succinylbenzoic acid--CoA ligase